MQDRSTSTAPGVPPQSALSDLAAIRNRQQATWSAGDYAVIGATLPLVSELLCEAVDLRAGSRVLDVATGSGNAALAAARRSCEVTGTDYVTSLLERARVRATAEGFAIEFREADAERQPFADASFDAVLSVFGAMFAPSPERTAAELLRVCKSGGRIGLASWTPEGFIGQSFRLQAGFLPPPPGIDPPVWWGRPERIEELFGKSAASITTSLRTFVFRYRSVAHFIETFRAWYGPTVKAFAALDPAGRASLERELAQLLEQSNQSGDDTLVVPSEYLEVVVTKR